jgi:SAM-dependent methyltransferase|tara:strand:- start:61468 stop:62118 length:651 start_codon:yes stop_codon:yes gene_type:complete
MKTLFNPPEYFNEDYYERGAETGKSLYSHYRWMPELTIPMAHHIAKYMDLHESEKVLDFGCAKGFTVKALRLLGYKAFGVDVSQYAFDEMDAKTGKWCGVIEPQEPLVCAEGGYDWILCKDILEHIPYDKIDEQLKVLYNGGKRVMAMIPLGDGEKYIIDSYELDKSHFIRESLQWWHEKFEQAGFDVDMSTYDMGPFKKNWQFEPEGNMLIIASR